MKKIVSLVLAAVMLLSLCAMEALALNAGETAEDGVYSSSVTVTKRSDGKLKYYYGTVYVTVSDGVISNMTVYASDKQSRFNDLLNSVKGSYIGKPATLETCSGIDAVSSASVGGSGSSSGRRTTCGRVQCRKRGHTGAQLIRYYAVIDIAERCSRQKHRNHHKIQQTDCSRTGAYPQSRMVQPFCFQVGLILRHFAWLRALL